jgi:actin-related protein
VMLRQIVLAGGVSMSAGMGERVRREVVELVEALETGGGGGAAGGAAGWDSASVTVICDSQRLHAGWIGGSMLGSLSTFSQMRITADQYKKDESCIQKRFM